MCKTNTEEVIKYVRCIKKINIPLRLYKTTFFLLNVILTFYERKDEINNFSLKSFPFVGLKTNNKIKNCGRL